ncbi:MAG: type II secretion system F family protein [Syntrophomonadaceae bacterium]|nr:type II secretion system F family protein [Syntrophomonadaceae bacterium]
MQYAVAGLVFLALMSAIAGLKMSSGKKGDIQDRLKTYAGAGQQGGGPKEKLTLKAIFQRMASLFSARPSTAKLQLDLLQADIPLKAEEFLAGWMLLSVAVPVFTWLLTRNVLLTIILLAAFLVAPRVYVQYKKKEQIRKLNEQLGDALLIMANALRAGFGFQQAMDTVRKEMPPPLSTEFEWTLREIRLGTTTEEALQHMAERVRSDDLDMIVTAVLIQRQVGGNLAEILENIAETIRERTRIRGEIKVLTAQGRISGLIIGLLPVVLLLVIMMVNPSYMNTMLQSAIGPYLLAAGAVFEVIGFWCIKKIVDIEV